MLKFCVRMVMMLTFAMAAFGLLIVSYAGKSQGQGPYHFFIMQAAFLVVGLIAAAVICRVDYRFFRNPTILWTLGAVMVVALLMVLTPGIGKSVKGSHRWIALGPINVQPVEFVKVGMVVFLSAYLERLGGMVNRFRQGFLIPVGLLGVVAGLLVLQPDFGGTAVVCFLSGLMLLMGGVGVRKCLALAVLGLLAIGLLVLTNENRMRRLMNEKEGENYQAQQSEIAFRNGGMFGVGLGEGMQKEHYLPECHTDFVFAVIGEDLGLVATGAVWTAFVLLLGCGTVIAFRARDKQGMLLAFGATMVLCAQGAANMAVVTHVFPTKGLALPFFSYGGSCLLASFCAVGLLLGVGRVTLEEEASPESAAKRLLSLD